MFEALSSPFMQRAFITGILVGVLMGLISVFIVLRRMSFVGAGISHAAFGGIALGFYLGINPVLSAIVYTICIALGIEKTSRDESLSGDTSVGIFYSVSMALGIVLTGFSKPHNVDLFGYLFGNILAINHTDIIITFVMTATISCFILAFLKELFLSTYNEELAIVSGVRVGLVNTAYLVALSIAIVVSVRIVGIVLVAALLVIPGAFARLFAKSLSSMIYISCSISLISVLVGLAVSYQFDISSGGSIVLTAASFFFLASIIKNARKGED